MNQGAPEANQPPAPDGATVLQVRWTVMDVVASVALGSFLGVLMAGVTSAVLFDGLPQIGLFFVIGIEIYAAIALVIWLLVVRRRGVSPEELGLRRVGPGTLVLMVPTAVVLFYANGVVAWLTSLLFGEVPTARDQLAVDDQLSVGDLVLLLVLTALVAPIVEEIIFRGLLYRVVRARWGIGAAAVFSALAFALVHFIPLLVGVFFVFGLILAAVAQRYESLYPAILLHSLNNAVVVLVLFGAG